MSVVGVVGNVRDAVLGSGSVAEIYACHQQNALTYNPLAHMNLVVLTNGSDTCLNSALLERIRALDQFAGAGGAVELTPFMRNRSPDGALTCWRWESLPP